MTSHTALEVRDVRGSSPRAVRGVDAVPRRRRGRRPPGGQATARDGPLADAEAEDVSVTSKRDSGHAPRGLCDRPLRARSPAAACELDRATTDKRFAKHMSESDDYVHRVRHNVSP